MPLDDSFEMQGNGSVRRNYLPSPEKTEPVLKWRDLMTNFSQATTFHGLRYILEKESHSCRRLIWFLLTVLFTVLLVLQIIDRVTYYYQSPITVNFQVNYNQSLHFPAITLCNQNAFRATAASRLGWYRVVEQLYGESETNFTWSDKNGGNITMDQLYLGLAHRREDFINSCAWAGEPCYAENFTLTLTDHGLCYTFNNLSNTDRDISVFSSGVEHGLRLTINTEQYEAMPGPHDTSGIKILVTDQSQFPRVDEVGVAIPTGAHSYIGLGVVVIKNLPKPHGDCGTRKLMSTDVYSPDMCRLEYVTNYVTNMCGCRHIYMPNINGDHPLCSIRQYLNCAKQAYDYIHKRVVEESSCPTSCDYKIFEMTTSSASTSSQVSNYDMKPDLEDRFHAAIETTHRLNDATFRNFETIVRHVSETFKNVKALLEQSIQEKLARQMEVLGDIQKNISDTVEEKDTIYRYQEYTMLKNFMRARDAMEERTLSMVCLGFHEHVFNTEFKLRHMFAAQQKGENEADVLYTLLKNTLRSRMETANRAIANQTQLYDAYATGQKIFNYKFRDIDREYNQAIVPKPLLAKSLVHNYYATRYAPRVKTDIELVLLSTKNFEELVDEIHENVSIGLNVSRMEEISGNFIDACEDFFHSKSTFYFEVVNRPLRIIVQRIQEFDSMKLHFDQTVAGLNASLGALNHSLTSIEEGFIKNLTDYLDMANQYFETNDSFGNITKYDLALAFTSTEITDYHHSLVVLFSDLRNKGQFIYSQWTELWSICHQIWKTILEDEDSIEYYNVRNIFQNNFTDIADELEAKFRKIQDDNDMRLIGETIDNVFTLTINDLIAHLQEFLARTKIDESFIKENFLTLDIYFKELRHEEIEQQKAYDVIALLCDIGGSMGLFLGASVLSIFELVDFLVHNSAVKLFPGCKKRKRAYSI